MFRSTVACQIITGTKLHSKALIEVKLILKMSGQLCGIQGNKNSYILKRVFLRVLSSVSNVSRVRRKSFHTFFHYKKLKSLN